MTGETLKTLRDGLLEGDFQIRKLGAVKDTVFAPIARYLIRNIGDFTLNDYENFIKLCLDYYSYTDDILIPDYDYDRIMEVYIKNGGKQIVNADPLVLNTWNLVKHKEPKMVGSITKTYEIGDLYAYYRKYRYANSVWCISPKYDGISACIELSGGKIVSAVTRYNGIQGQDITEVVRRASNAHNFMWNLPQYKENEYFVKVELCVSNESFIDLIKEKEYSNRRSATSGIINSPKNIELGKFITIIPLIGYSKFNNCIYVTPLDGAIYDDIGSEEAFVAAIEETVSRVRNPLYPYRTDGVVIFPLMADYQDDDIMSEAIAFKINTKLAPTTVKRLYVSVGRTGEACPKVEVEPVECNETRVTDVSLGSFDKMVSFGLKEGETVLVYSAGDVIPQITPLEERQYPDGAEPLYVPLECPYCGTKFTRIGKEYFCKNEDCFRIKTGRIANFIEKLGMMNISDATVEDLYREGFVENLTDIFKITEEDIVKLDGYGELSANNIISEIKRSQYRPIPMNEFIGALGIPKIGKKVAKKLLSEVSIKDIKKKSIDEIFSLLVNANGIGMVLACNFTEYLKNNIDEFMELLSILNIQKVKNVKGEVVLTGFRDEEIEKEIESHGYGIGTDVTKENTIAVISRNTDYSSSKCKKAIKYDIPIFPLKSFELFREFIKDPEAYDFNGEND